MSPPSTCGPEWCLLLGLGTQRIHLCFIAEQRPWLWWSWG